ncbi:DUF4439 domain-containing protein, partial [Cellulomonas citrea]|uniref:DUF4439 domain-containing protein n=1 Tax=Cellulomonas citrea TaxID=1909423 RepID=UPI001358FB73
MTSFVRRLALTLTLVLATAGCGVRLATPAPTEPSPGPVEQVRARTVADSLELAATATALAATGLAEPVAAVLAEVSAQSTAHAAALGGVYRSGLPSSTPTATGTASAPVPTAAQLLTDLVAAAGTASVDTDTLTDGALARLVGSVATARTELAARLAAALGTPVPAPAPVAAPAPTGASTSPATPQPSPSTTSLPAGTLSALVLAHDQAGYGLEVIAARGGPEKRPATLAAARAQRADAERWAQAAGLAGTKSDPRRAQYALPAGLEQADVASTTAVSLLTAVAQAYGAALAAAPAGGRAALLTGLMVATAAARDLGGAPVT